MNTKNPPQPSQTRYGTARPQRQRVSITDLMRGGREVIAQPATHARSISGS
jgi:hypothetical protein